MLQLLFYVFLQESQALKVSVTCAIAVSIVPILPLYGKFGN